MTALTLDALVEKVARATGPYWWVDQRRQPSPDAYTRARAALAAQVATAGVNRFALIYAANALEDTGNHDEEGHDAVVAVAALLRALAEAADKGGTHG